MTTFKQQLAEGFGQLLAAAPGSIFTWSATAQYTAGQTALFVGTPLPDFDRCTTITPYDLTADPTLATSQYGVQFLSRGGRDAGLYDVWNLDDAVTGTLLGLFPVTLATGVHVATLTYANGGSLGMDTSNRWNWQTSFTATVKRATAHR